MFINRRPQTIEGLKEHKKMPQNVHRKHYPLFVLSIRGSE